MKIRPRAPAITATAVLSVDDVSSSVVWFRAAEFLRARCGAVIKREAENVEKIRGSLIEHRSKEC